MKTIIKGNIVAEGRIISGGYVAYSDGVIDYVGNDNPAKTGDTAIDCSGKLVCPGFVDIHCHAGGNFFAYDDPVEMAKFHLKHGTTGLLCTLYRDLSFECTLSALDKIKAAMLTQKNILGAHMEGPYISARYGSKQGEQEPVLKEVYGKYIDSGIIRQWTYAPEVEGTDAFVRDIVRAGIVPAIGHSEASPRQVFDACAMGAGIVTHLMNATGTSINPTRYGGTKEVSFDDAAMLCDGLYYEIICDRMGIHLRPEMIKLIIKTVGIDRVIGITDYFAGSKDDSDINMLDGQLTGSKLTMDRVAVNLKNLGLSITDIFKVLSENPAKAINMYDKTGSLQKGKRADIIITDTEFSHIEIPQNTGH